MLRIQTNTIKLGNNVIGTHSRTCFSGRYLFYGFQKEFLCIPTNTYKKRFSFIYFILNFRKTINNFIVVSHTKTFLLNKITNVD